MPLMPKKSSLKRTGVQRSGFPKGKEAKLKRVLYHAAHHSPYYRDQDWARRLRKGHNIELGDVPITEKETFRSLNESFITEKDTPHCGRRHSKFTSGSTGTPIRAIKTDEHFRMNSAENDRLLKGWDINGYETAIMTRPSQSLEDTENLDNIKVEKTPDGRTNYHITSHSSAPIIEVLNRTRIRRLDIRPSVAMDVLDKASGLEHLRLIKTIAETIPPGFYEVLEKMPLCRHLDFYGSSECGIMAVKCSECSEYHVASFHLEMEFINENGEPAKPGELAKVIATPLHNMAMPMLRYDIEDYVRISEKRDCKRSSLALSEIVGRERNLFIRPDGKRIAPTIDIKTVFALGIKQVKFIQREPLVIDVLYVPGSPEVEMSIEVAQRLVDYGVSSKIRAVPVRMTEIPRLPNGKFLTHECLL